MGRLEKFDVINESASSICKALGSKSIIWINPAHVQFQVSKYRPRHHRWLLQAATRCRRLDSGMIFEKNVRRYIQPRFFLSDSEYQRPVPIEDSEMYRLVLDYVSWQGQLEKTIWYNSLMADISQSGCAWHDAVRMRSDGDVRGFFSDHVEPLRVSMSTSGYDMARATDTGRCYISSDGDIHKGAHARHRLMFAKVLGVDRFPLQVYGIHRSWFASRFDRFDFEGIETAVEAVEARFR